MRKKPPISTRYNGYMYEDFYKRITAPWRSQQNGGALLTNIDKALRVLFVVLYGALLVWLTVLQSPLLLRAVLVPLFTFVLVSLWRNGVNWQRPYEKHNIEPLIPKNTQGKSFPSRHMASATIIACTLIWAAATFGHPLLWVAAVLGTAACGDVAYARIVGGVHFPRDIIAGAITGIVCALIGFVFIP